MTHDRGRTPPLRLDGKRCPFFRVSAPYFGTQPTFAMKHVPLGHWQTVVGCELVGEQLHAPTAQLSGNGAWAAQQSTVATTPPLEVQRISAEDAASFATSGAASPASRTFPTGVASLAASPFPTGGAASPASRTFPTGVASWAASLFPAVPIDVVRSQAPAIAPASQRVPKKAERRRAGTRDAPQLSPMRCTSLLLPSWTDSA